MSQARIARTVTAVAALSLALAACAANGTNSGGGGSNSSNASSLPVLPSLQVPADAANPAGNGNATCNGVTLAFGGAESGPNAQLGINILNGMQLAITQHNQKNPKCQVQLKKFDTEGDPGKAPGQVTQMVSEKDIIGAVGLAFSGESKAADPIFEQNGLVHITASATNPDLAKSGFKTFFRALGNDAVQGPAAAKFMTDTLHAKKVCVIQDDSDYGIGLAAAAIKTLGSVDDTSCNDKVTTGQKDFSSVVSKVTSAKPDAVFYSGYYAEAAPFDSQLVTKGFSGTFVGPDGVKDPKFLQQAGPAASNAVFTCPCVPGDLVPAFATAYKQAFNSTPGTYSLEGYDAATILLKGIDSGKNTRATLLSYVKSYNGDGLSKHFQWDSTGELTQTKVYAYKVQNNNIVASSVIG